MFTLISCNHEMLKRNKSEYVGGRGSTLVHLLSILDQVLISV